MYRLIVALIVLFVALPSMAVAKDTVRHYIFTELASGGDTLVEPDSGRSLKAGQLLEVAYGASFSNEALHWVAMDFRAGVKADYISVSGGDAYFVRYPLELAIAFDVYRGFNLGLGVALHLLPSYGFDAENVSDRVDFDEAWGGFLQAQYNFNRFALGMRFLSIEYKKEGNTFVLPDGEVKEKVDGSSAGVYFNWYFN